MGKTGPKPINPVIRFWRYVHKTEDCWEWTGAKRGGYGRFGICEGGTIDAHRFSWEIHRGAIPAGLYVLHACDNRACVRVGKHHLFLGTQLTNMRDASKKGRMGGPRPTIYGISNPSSKLTERDVLSIRERDEGGETQGFLAAEFGVHLSTVENIVARKSWKHI